MTEKKRPKGNTTYITACVATAAMLGFGLGVISPYGSCDRNNKPGTATSTKREIPEVRSAAYACRELVIHSLKSPASASFPIEIEDAQKLKDGILFAAGYVETQDSLGLQTYSCRLSKIADNWVSLGPPRVSQD